MKIILTQEVTGLGTPGDVVEVKDGFGRNYLLPQGFAIPWTKGAEKQITLIKRARVGPRDPGSGPRQRGAYPARVAQGQPVRRGPATVAGCSARSPRPRSWRPSGPPAVPTSTGAGWSCPGTSSRPAATRCRSSCTRRSPRSSRVNVVAEQVDRSDDGAGPDGAGAVSRLGSPVPRTGSWPLRRR